MKPKRIQLSRKKGWKMPPNTIKVSRPSKWGNMFVIGKDGTRQQCIDRFRKYIDGNIWTFPSKQDVKEELRGKNLACFCPLDQPCHADVLLEIANK